ncbi:MAG: EamA family transporter [Methylobacterium sp.]|nr:MAG: EamA family transporter [Methylobacterium sp.]
MQRNAPTGGARGFWNCLAGILIFSGSLPATRVAVLSLDPVFLTHARAALAGLLGGILLFALHASRPRRKDLLPLLVVAGGVVIGFPLFTGLALRHVGAADAIGFLGLLPLSTTVFGFIRGGERPKPVFWGFAILGAAIVMAGSGLSLAATASEGVIYMLMAVLVCGLGYAEGAILARRLGGWQVISWALVLSLPVSMGLTLRIWPDDLLRVDLAGWLAFLYVSIFSMLVGFIFWYRGLAMSGIALSSQLQLLQPFAAFMLAALVLGESVSLGMIGTAAAVMFCVAGARRFG